MEKKKILCLVLFSFFTLISFSSFVFAKEIEIKDDPKRDLRIFDIDDLEDIDLDDIEDIGDVEDEFYELWQKGKDTQTPTYCDLLSSSIDLGTSSGNSTFILELRDDPEEDMLFMIWCDCKYDTSFFLMGILGTFGFDETDMGFNQSDEYNLYIGQNSIGDSVYGKINFGNEKVKFEFPTSWLQYEEEPEECFISVFTEDEDDHDVIIGDICPNFDLTYQLLGMDFSSLMTFPNLLLYGVIAVIMISIQVYARKKALG